MEKHHQYQSAACWRHSEQQPSEQDLTVPGCMNRRIRGFDIHQTIARTAIATLSAGLFLIGVAPAFSEPTLTFDPPPGTRLSNFDAYLTITFDLDGESWDTLPWDWQNPRVRLNGVDISLPVRSLISGATASVLTPDEIVVSQQTMSGDRMELALSGLRLDDGFNRLIVELEPIQEGIDPLKFDVSYPVIAGQDQATQ